MLRVLEFREEKPVAWEVYDMESSNGVPIYDTTDILDLILYLSDSGKDFKVDPYRTQGDN